MSRRKCGIVLGAGVKIQTPNGFQKGRSSPPRSALWSPARSDCEHQATSIRQFWFSAQRRRSRSAAPLCCPSGPSRTIETPSASSLIPFYQTTPIRDLSLFASSDINARLTLGAVSSLFHRFALAFWPLLAVRQSVQHASSFRIRDSTCALLLRARSRPFVQ